MQGPQMEEHIAKNHMDKSGYNCGKCDKSFKSEEELKDHVSSTHTEPTMLSCRVCDFITATKVNFMLHMESHNKDENLNDKTGRSGINMFSWFLRGQCMFGSPCWNIHLDPPQCNYKGS